MFAYHGELMKRQPIDKNGLAVSNFENGSDRNGTAKT